jgi:hypothetical protein
MPIQAPYRLPGRNFMHFSPHARPETMHLARPEPQPARFADRHADCFGHSHVRLRRWAIEDLTARLAAAHPSDAALAVLARLLAVLAQRRRLRREALLLLGVVVAANLAAGVRWMLGVDEAARPHVLGAWLAVLMLSAVAFARVAWIRPRLRALSGCADELVAVLRWLYRAA